MDKYDVAGRLVTIWLWCKVAASPLLIGLFAAAGLWFGLATTFGKVAAVVVGLLGLVLGIYVAERLRRRNALIDFESATLSSHEFGVKDDAPRGPRT